MSALKEPGKSSLIFLFGILLLAVVLVSLSGPAGADGTVLVNLGDNVTTQEDVELSITPWVSYTGTGSLTYAWDFGDGSTSSQDAPSKTYTKSGDYPVSLTVTDGDGTTDSDSITVTVLNVKPIADPGGDRTVVEGTTATFDGSNSWDSPSDLPLLTYEWWFGDGTGSTGSSAENKVVTHEYAETGVYIVRLVVRDDDWGESDEAYFESQLIDVSGASQGNGTVFFNYYTQDTNGTGSSQSFPYEFFWDYGDGTTGEGYSSNHSYAQDGVYIVTLIITDNFGAMDVHHILVTVLNAPPIANAGEDLSLTEDEVGIFMGTGSDPGGGPVTFHWDFGDGTDSTLAMPAHSYTKSGVYTVTLTVTDADGTSSQDTCSATVVNVPPVAGLTSNHTTEEGDVIGFFGYTSYDTPSDMPLLTYRWDMGDGTTKYGIDITHAYADEGTYTVTLTVIDDDDADDVTTLSVPVDNAAPSATITSVTWTNDTLLQGDTMSVSGTGSDPGIYDILSYYWSFGDGTTADGQSATHAYTSPGTYTVTLFVTDGDGGTGTASTTVTVESLEETAEEGQETVEDAPPDSFSKPQDQQQISEKFDDLIDALDEGNENKANGQITALEAQISSKVDDEDLKDELLDLLERIRSKL